VSELSLSGAAHRDRVVLVTGAGTGIGRAIALGFAGEGAHVVAVGRRSAPLEAVAAEAAGLPGRIEPFPGDVADRGLGARLAAHLAAGPGCLDALVHNAGVFAPDRLETLDEATFERTLAINLAGPLFLTRDLMPWLVKGDDPAVVLVSSNLGVKPIANTLSYSVSKAALNHAVLCLAPELGAAGVRVAAVSPGVIDTPIHDRFGSAEERQAYFDALAAVTPVARTGQPEDVAHVVRFLASARAGYVTGTNLVIDGGLMLT